MKLSISAILHGSFSVHILTISALAFSLVALTLAASAQSVGKATFRVNPPGKVAAGRGAPDYRLYAPAMQFPIAKEFASTLNSQVHRPGGLVGGDQCNARNYNEEWQDTLCETRGAKSDVPLGCPRPTVHQGIDIRAGSTTTCRDMQRGKRNIIPIVSTAEGRIVSIGSYTVSLRTLDGEKYRFMHMNMANLQVREGQSIAKGDVIGFLDNDFGGSSTTFHLHLEHWMNIANEGFIPVPLYCDLVNSYAALHGKSYEIVGGGRRCDVPPASQPDRSAPSVPSETVVSQPAEPAPSAPNEAVARGSNGVTPGGQTDALSELNAMLGE